MSSATTVKTAERPERNALARSLPFVSIGLVVASSLYLLACIGEPLRQNWGDPWSDANAMTAGRFFARDGFFKHAFTPTLDIDPLGADALKYTHYPPLPDVINGLWQTVLGTTSLTVFRAFAVAFALGGLFFLYRYIARLWGKPTAFFALPLFATNILYLQYADTIHHVPLYWCAGFGALHAASRWLDNGKRSALVLGMLGTVLCLLASYDFYFFLPVMLATTVVVHGERWRSRRVVTLLGTQVVALGLGVLVKLLLVIWAVGFRGFVNDMVFQFFERSTARHAEDYTGAFGPMLVGRVWRFFGPVFLVALLAQLGGLVDRWVRRRDAVVSSPLFVLLAGIPFLAIFTQLFCEQYHPTLQLLPYYAIGVGAFFAHLFTRPSPKAHAAAYAGLALCVTWQVIEVCRLRKAFVEPTDIAGVQKALEGDRRQQIFSNGLVDASTRYYWQRYAFGITLERELPIMREMFDLYGHEGPFTIVEFMDSDRVAYDKGIYPFFAGERRWHWTGSPFYYRNEWRPRVDTIKARFAESAARVGTVTFVGKNIRTWTVTLDELDRRQRDAVPPGDTRFIDFETRAADRYKLYGFGPAEQYDRNHGFSWLQARIPRKLMFTLKGLRPRDLGEPIKTSALRVRLTPGRDYLLTASGWTEGAGQTLSLRVNHSSGVETVAADSPKGPRDYVFHIPRGALNEDGVQDLEFSYERLDAYGNAVLFHSLVIDPVAADGTTP